MEFRFTNGITLVQREAASNAQRPQHRPSSPAGADPCCSAPRTAQCMGCSTSLHPRQRHRSASAFSIQWVMLIRSQQAAQVTYSNQHKVQRRQCKVTPCNEAAFVPAPKSPKFSATLSRMAPISAGSAARHKKSYRGICDAFRSTSRCAYVQ